MSNILNSKNDYSIVNPLQQRVLADATPTNIHPLPQAPSYYDIKLHPLDLRAEVNFHRKDNREAKTSRRMSWIHC